MSDTELKPIYCPCCGSDRTEMIMIISGTQYAVMCDDCGLISGGNPTKEEAVRAWNTRKPMERIVEQLEDLRDVKADRFNISKYGIMQMAIEIVREGGAE